MNEAQSRDKIRNEAACKAGGTGYWAICPACLGCGFLEACPADIGPYDGVCLECGGLGDILVNSPAGDDE